MNNTVQKLLDNNINNHIMPFLWVHGENAAVYRKMVRVIDEANIKAFCIEARPHEHFCQDEWWQDLDVILDEAERRSMKVWILDDKHFPTGYANGGALKAPLELRRQSICNKQITVKAGKKIKIDLSKHIKPQKTKGILPIILDSMMNKGIPKLYDDQLFSCVAYSKDSYLDISKYIDKNVLCWQVPQGEWTIEVCFLTRDVGMHRSYINMMDSQSCKILIDEVYEPHYAHYKDKFGKVIAGFFSDEPELGNGVYCNFNNVLGTKQDLPYSATLDYALKNSLGEDYKTMLPMLWNNNYNKAETAKVRYVFMDCVTRLVEASFSKQVGEWCSLRGVQYIGHVIEDNNQHARTGSSLGHFFRGLKHQSMAGIDNIGGQVYLGQEDSNYRFNPLSFREGEFYHYCLGKLGSSLAAVNPNMQGRTMCEIFGNYGWSEGVRLEKYLIDHFAVRGINYFVPHAFTCSEYPDKDCPPHFYAMGHNPQYRHFGQLMKYTNRLCNLFSGGKRNAPVAVLYHAEAEWSGKAMLMQKPARTLWDSQIDFDFVPSDVFGEQDFYKTEITDTLIVNGNNYKLLIVPYSEYITKEVNYGIDTLINNGGKAVFIDNLPLGVCTGENLSQGVQKCNVVKLEKLQDYLDSCKLNKVEFTPTTNRIRVMNYINANSNIFYLVNESTQTYNGNVFIEQKGNAYIYDAWNNTANLLAYTQKESGTYFDVIIEPSKSIIVVFDDENVGQLKPQVKLDGTKTEIVNFKQSVCKSIDYPKFGVEKDIVKLVSYSEVDKSFSGLIKYSTQIVINDCSKALLEITDAYEGVEVFVNGKSAGIQVVPSFVFDITSLCKIGKNEIVIEVATTLARERGAKGKKLPTGIIGKVNLYTGGNK